MSLLISGAGLESRRKAARTSLAPLAQSLAADLAPLLDRELYYPSQKALLSREGGRCALDGSLLEFDPFAPHEHRCPRCGTVHSGELHDRFWIYWYQLWLAERAVHAAMLSTLGVDDRFAAFAATILDGYVERYDTYPNVDNVLGPTRLFFSTYLESIWLLNICVATDLLDARHSATADRVRDRIVGPSRAIIAEYDEGASNRQVWNDAALLAAARLLDDERAAEQAVFGASGVAAHLAGGLLADGTWFEGENYHLFAHRGLWYGVTMAERAGLELPDVLVERFARGFATPFATALPDFTLPSRRDSQYAISLRQWRIAEHCELGLARAEDSALIGALYRLYNDDVPRRDTGRARSSADVERNGPASSLSRADSSWRALLCARETLPSLESVAPRSELLEAQGIAVFRRESGRVYVALDYGHSGGGHGHPDRLNLLLADGETRWLDDYGTGSYVDPSLHWYRSSLAHNAPFVNGVSQRRVDGTLSAYDERGAAGWIVSVADGISPNASVERAIVVMSQYLIDEIEWNSGDAATVDLPFHFDAALDDGVDEMLPAVLQGGHGTEDGFRFVRDTAVQRAVANTPVHGKARTAGGAGLEMWSRSDSDVEWWRAVAPGPPGSGDQAFRLVRASSPLGRHQSVLAWSNEVTGVQFGGEIRVSMKDGTTHVHRRTHNGWQVELHAAQAHSTIDLGGFVPVLESAPILGEPPESRALRLAELGGPLELGEKHYRRSENAWHDLGSEPPTARVYLSSVAGAFHITIEVPESDLTFVAAGAVNPYDNEPADINGDGVQLYVRTDRGESGWVLVPERASTAVRIRQIEGWGAPATLSASWAPAANGYRMDIALVGTHPSSIDVVVNEMPRGRQRRRGQLVLSGGRGEFVYLRGDRHDAIRLIPIEPVEPADG